MCPLNALGRQRGKGVKSVLFAFKELALDES